MRFLACALSLLVVLASSGAEAKRGKGLIGPAVHIVSTSKSGDKLTRRADIPFTQAAASKNTIVFDKSRTFQPIFGFGGAITEASSTILQTLKGDLVEEVLEAYYGRNGLRYTVGRVPMNSCDFSLESYSFDDVDGDFSLSHFDNSLQHNEDNFMIPFIQKALNASEHKMRLFFTPWSPPAWMKSNGQMTGSSDPCLKKGDDYSKAWANYYVKWVQAHKDKGIPFWGLTVQNEPEYAAPWEACTYTPEEERDFIKNFLGPTLENSGFDLKVIIYDHNKDHVYDWAKVIFADPDAAKYVWGTGLHWYSGDSFDNVNSTHWEAPEKHIFATEACHCPFALNDFSRGEKYAHDIIGDLNSWSEGWTDWNIVLNPQGGPNHLGNMCDAPILADPTWPDLHYQPTYYAMGHFSKYLPPGSQRIHWRMTDENHHNTIVDGFATDGKNATLEITAFLVNDSDWIMRSNAPKKSKHHRKTTDGDEAIVLIVLNSSDDDQDFSIPHGSSNAKISVEKHSMLTLTVDASLFS